MLEPRTHKVAKCLVAASLIVLAGCTGHYAGKPYCEPCMDALLLGGAAAYQAGKPVSAVSGAFARGPMPSVADAAPGSILLLSSFDTGPLGARAYWVRPDAILLKIGQEAWQPMKPDGTPGDIVSTEPAGYPIGMTGDGLLLSRSRKSSVLGRDIGTDLKLLDPQSFQLHPVPDIGCSPETSRSSALSPDGGRLWCPQAESIVAFDTRTWRETGRISRKAGPRIGDGYAGVGLSDDGGFVVATFGGKILRYPAGATAAATVAELRDSEVRSLIALPGANAVVVATNDVSRSGGFEDTGRVVIVDLSTGGQRTLTGTRAGDSAEFSVSGDGLRLAVMKTHDVELYETLSGRLMGRITTGDRYRIGAQLNKAGDRLVVTAGPKVAVFQLPPCPPAISATLFMNKRWPNFLAGRWPT